MNTAVCMNRRIKVLIDTHAFNFLNEIYQYQKNCRIWTEYDKKSYRLKVITIYTKSY